MRPGRRRAVVAVATLYSILLLLGLTFWRLPADRMIPFLADRISGGRVLLKTEKAVLSFPLGCKLEKVSFVIVSETGPARGRFENMVLRVNPLGLVRARLPVSFKAKQGREGGVIEGSAGISVRGKRQNDYFQCKADHVDLEQLGFLKSFSDRGMKGRANWEVSLRNLAEPNSMQGQGNIVVQKGSVDTKMDLAGLKSIPFEIVRVVFKVKDGLLSLEKGEMEGPMLSGTLSGQIKLNKNIRNTLLDLTARLKPGPLLEKNPLASAFLGRIKEGKNEIVLKVGGSVDKPTLTGGH